ncbi:MAG: type II toxin-antitoxin system HicA family toxin [bacterium]|nr:type II toxin-antitoxin system HicA family toxin [bacterium]
MGIVPILHPKEVINALSKAGFEETRQVGSHVRLRHITDKTRQTSVPVHSGTIPKWLLREILKQAKISVQELHALLHK